MKHILLIILGVVLVGCEAQATPIAAISTVTPIISSTATPVSTIRYGVLADSAPYLDLSDLQDILSIEILGSMEQVNEYDIVLGLGRQDGWQELDIQQHISLAINSNLAPLSNQTLYDLVPQVIDTQALMNNINISGTQQTRAQQSSDATSIRTILANNGYPDGLTLLLAAEAIPILDTIVNQYDVAGISLQLTDIDSFEQNQAHLALFMWIDDAQRTTWVEQVGEENLVDLVTIPISYFSADTINIEFTETGFPIPVQ